MEEKEKKEKKTIKISLGAATVIGLVVIVTIVALVGTIMVLIEKKNKEDKNVANNTVTNTVTKIVSDTKEDKEFQKSLDESNANTTTTNTVNNTLAENKTVMNTNSNNTNTTNNVETNTTAVTFTDEQVKKLFSDYLDLYANANCGIPLDALKAKGKIDYDSSKSIIDPNTGEITTNVKFSDYKTAMLNYVTESEFEKNWTSKIHLKADSNGYFTHGPCGGAFTYYTVNSVTKMDNSTYSAKVTAMIENDASTKTNEDYTFTVKSYNGKCVIDTVK